MRDPNRLREQARRCYTLTKIVIDPELVEHADASRPRKLCRASSQRASLRMNSDHILPKPRPIDPTFSREIRRNF